jgi:ribose/xylose/arabinose/galactoside ABC-type transport system permease subunit
LSVGSVVAFTGVMTGLALNAHLPVPVAVLIGIGIGALSGGFIAFAVTTLNMSPFIVSLAVLAMARGLAFIVTNGNTIFSFPDAFDNIGGGNIGPFPVAALITLAVFLVAGLVLGRTVFGAEVYAVGGNRDAARLAGIPVSRTLACVYIISGALAGLGGVILTGRLDSAQPIAAVGLELNAIAAVVIGGASLFGGKGSILGTLLGVLIIGLINNGLTLKNVQPFWVQFIQGAVIFGAVLIDSLNQKRRRA